MPGRFAVVLSVLFTLLSYPFVGAAAPDAGGKAVAEAPVTATSTPAVVPVTATSTPVAGVGTGTGTAAGVVPPAIPTPGMEQPTTPAEALGTGKDLIGAVQAKAWWLVSAGAILIVMFALNFFGFFKWIGTMWSWVAVGVLSLAAGLLASFHQEGFSWGTVLTFMSAGPTVAWMRDFAKDGPLKALYAKIFQK